jgi:hypothetical protein
MPTESIIISVAVITIFTLFGLVLAYADRVTNGRL